MGSARAIVCEHIGNGGLPNTVCRSERIANTPVKILKDAGHLLRLASVFLAGIILFLLVRGFLVPRSFGQYGHYRGNAIAEIAAHPVAFAGHQTCETCHSDVLRTKTKRKARASQLRGVPWSAGKACGRPGLGQAGKTGSSRALRPLSPGEYRQTETVSAGRCGGAFGRSRVRYVPPAA